MKLKDHFEFDNPSLKVLGTKYDILNNVSTVTVVLDPADFHFMEKKNYN